MDEKDKDSIKTDVLLDRLFKSSSLENYISDNEEALIPHPFCDHLKELCRAKGLVPERIINQSQIERTYGHQIFNGTRKPSRDKVILLALGFGLDVEGAQKLLTLAGKSPLYPRIKRDAAILFCINKQFSALDTQEMLSELGLTLLGEE